MKMAVLTTSLQNLYDRLASLNIVLAISCIVRFLLSMNPFSCGGHANEKFSLVTCHVA
jgi:hypothetical protein